MESQECYESEVDNEEDPADIESEPDSPISPFSPYHQLLVNIKSSLTSTRKKSTHVRVRMAFDKLLFDGGSKARGINAGCGHYYIYKRRPLIDYEPLQESQHVRSKRYIIQATCWH